MNLALFRYGRILADRGGPVERIDYGPVDVGGNGYCQANAYLSARLNLPREELRVFATADGTGTHRSALVARHMAISEALERWALHHLLRTGPLGPYGLDVDSSSTGFAAFPGLLARQARRRARAEAVERFCIAQWQRGRLGSRPLAAAPDGTGGIEIDNPLGRQRVVLLWRAVAPGCHAHGSAADAALDAAVERARVEMERSATALKRFRLENPGFTEGDLDTIPDPGEREILRRSLPDGHWELLARAAARPASVMTGPLRPLVDRSVDGPWRRFAHVWRVLYPDSHDTSGRLSAPAGRGP